MAGIGDSWGTKEELLHPRGPDGKWIRKGGIAKSIIGAVLDFLANFRPRTFQSKQQSTQYLHNIAGRSGSKRMGRLDHIRLRNDLGHANADLRDGVIDEPSTKRFVEMMDRSATELPDDVILTRVVPVEAFGFTPQTATGTSSDTDPGIRGLSGKLIADRGYSLTTIGGVQGTPPQGSVRMVVAAKKGTKVIIPAAGPNDPTIFMDRGQPLRVTKVAPDGAGGWTVYVTAESHGGPDIPEPIAGPVGEGRKPSKEREARLKEAAQEIARHEDQPDEAKIQADLAERRRRFEEAQGQTPVPSPAQEAERRRVEQLPPPGKQTLPSPPGTPPARQEPIHARSIGGEPRPEVGPGGVPQGQAPGAPEAWPAVDLRRAVQESGIRRPEAGPNRKKFNDAYEGVASGKKDPIDAAQELDRDADDLAEIGHPDAESFRELSNLIQREYGPPSPAPVPVKKAAKKAVPRTAAGLPKVAPSQLQEIADREQAVKEARKAAKVIPAPPTPAPVKKVAPSGSMSRDQEDRVIARAQQFRGHERNAEEERIVGLADDILARRQGGAPVKKVAAPAVPAKKAAPTVGVSTEDHVAALREINDREQAAEYLSHIRGKALDDLGRHYSVPPRLNAEQRRGAILDAEVGRRLETEAISVDLGGGGKGRLGRVEGAKKVAPTKRVAPTKKTAPQAPGDDLDKMTKKELMDVALKEGVTHGSSKTKDKLKADIRRAREAGPVEPGSSVGKENRVREIMGLDKKPTVAQLRDYAREHGIDSKGGGEGVPLTRMRRDGLIKLILDEQETRGRRTPQPTSPVKKAAKAVPGAVPGTTAGKGPSGHPGDTGMARHLVPEQQERQVKLDRVNAYGTLGTEIDELVFNGASPKALAHRIRARGKQNLIPDEDVAELIKAAESGDNDRVRALMRGLMDREGITQIGTTGDIVPLDRKNHQALGNAGLPRDTEVVHVVRPGSRATVDGDDVLIDRATVEPANAEEVAQFERSRRLVPEGSVTGDRPQTPITSTPRKRTFTEAWDTAELGTEGSPARSMKEIRDDVASGKITPEEGIRRMEDEIAFNKEDLAEIDANLRQGDLTDAERAKLQENAAVLTNGIEAQEKASKFMRLYFADEKPTVEEFKVSLDAEGYKAIQEATPDSLREAAKEAGLNPPKGQTKDEILKDLVRQVAEQEIKRRGIKKAAPAKKVAKKAAPAPQVPRDKERVDARLLAEGLDVDDKYITPVQDDLDRGKLTPRQIAEKVDEHARALSDSTAIQHGGWTESTDPNSPDYDPEYADKQHKDLELGRARAQALHDFAERIRGTRRRSAKAPAKKATPEVQAAEVRADGAEARLINDHLERVSKAKSRVEADRELDDLTMPELRRIGDSMGVKGRSKRELRDKILDRLKPEPEPPTPGGGPSLSRRAHDAGIPAPQGTMFEGTDSGISEADRRLKAGESPTDVARFLRERATQVSKGDLNEEKRRHTTELDQESLKSIRRSSAEYLRRIATMIQQDEKKRRPAKKVTPTREERIAAHPIKRGGLTLVRGEGGGRSTETGTRPALKVVPPVKKAAPAKKTVKKAAPEAGTEQPKMSDKPILENSWGGRVTKVHFHRDGIIGSELRRMGDDQKLSVDGEPLANVVGEWATDAVMGRISQDQLIQRLKRLADQLPAGSKGRKGVERMVEELDAPKRGPLDLPEGTPAPVTKLMQRLSEIPLARGGGRRVTRGDFNEMDAVQDVVRRAQERYPEEGDLAQMRRMRWMEDELRREVLNHRHESEEGKFDIDRVVREAMEELKQLVEDMRKART